jgi:hypothetical protein
MDQHGLSKSLEKPFFIDDLLVRLSAGPKRQHFDVMLQSLETQLL